MPRAPFLEVYPVRSVVACAIVALLTGAGSSAASSTNAPATISPDGRVEYMIVPKDLHDTFWSSPPEFEAAATLAPQWQTPSEGTLYWVRVYPASSETWALSDCIFRLEPAFMHFTANWIGPDVPRMNLTSRSYLTSDQLTGGVCYDFGPTVPYFEFTIDARAGFSWRLSKPSPEELLLGPEATASLIFFIGLAGIAVVFAFLLALFFGSVRILLQSLSTSLLLYILIIRYGGLELNILDFGLILEYRIPGRVFIIFAALYGATGIWDLVNDRRQYFLAALSLTAAALLVLPIEWFRVIFGNPYIVFGGAFLAVGLILNLYNLTVRRGEPLAQVVRLIRIFLLVLILAGVLQATGRFEASSMLPIWGFGLLLETLITVVLGLREQRQFTDLTRSLEIASSEVSQRRVSLKEDLRRLRASNGSMVEENEALYQTNTELKLAMNEVSGIAAAIKRKQQRMHFSELLGFRLAGLGHDLMNPLGLARGIMDLLPDKSWTEDAQGAKSDFIDEIDRMTSLRTAVRIFGRPEIINRTSDPNGRSRVFEVARTVEISIDLFRLSGTNCQIDTCLNQQAIACGSAGDLSRVVVELLSNAERAIAESERPAKIRIELTVDSGNAILTIHDSGKGFSVREFTGYTLDGFGGGPVKETEEFHLGLGLIMCLRLVTDLGGEIALLTAPSDLGGASMQLTLPLANPPGHL